MKSLLIGLVVLVLVFFGITYLVNTDSEDAPAGSTPTTTPPTADEPNQNGDNALNVPTGFRLHAEPADRYQLAIPYSVDVSSPQAGITRYRYVGPGSQANSEITDGYTVTISADEADVNSLAALEAKIAERAGSAGEAAIETVTVAGETALRYERESALGNQTIMHYGFLPGNDYVYDISVNISPTDNASYESTIDQMLGTIDFQSAASAVELEQRIVPIAMLDYSAVGDQYLRESGGPERGCDRVVLIEHVLPEPTTSPLTASLNQLFAYERDLVGGWQNFIASQNDTLSFERAEISDGTARIYLTGELGSLAGVCDNPRAAIQIEETALAYDTVDSVELYLNGEPTDLIPSGEGS